jgi:hypothetical protein
MSSAIPALVCSRNRARPALGAPRPRTSTVLAGETMLDEQVLLAAREAGKEAHRKRCSCEPARSFSDALPGPAKIAHDVPTGPEGGKEWRSSLSRRWRRAAITLAVLDVIRRAAQSNLREGRLGPACARVRRGSTAIPSVGGPRLSADVCWHERTATTAG